MDENEHGIVKSQDHSKCLIVFVILCLTNFCFHSQSDLSKLNDLRNSLDQKDVMLERTSGNSYSRSAGTSAKDKIKKSCKIS